MDKTIKLYYENSRASGFSAVVTACSPSREQGLCDVVLDQTLFYPEGGGQPYDTGVIGGARVSAVYERDGIVIHETDKPFSAGDAVSCRIDWDRRFAFMQSHTGEHIVSGLILRLYGLSNVGFHIGKEFTTIDVDGPLSAPELDILETLANQAVYENIPVDAAYPDLESMRSLDFRCKLPEDRLVGGEIRIVAIPGYDACACCGVHCERTGDVGIIKFLDAHKYKGGTRIYMLCGGPALADYKRKNKDIHALSALLSAKPQEIQPAVLALLADIDDAKARLAVYKNRAFEAAVETIRPGSAVFTQFEDGLSPDDLRCLATLAAGRAELAAVFSGSVDEYKYALSSKTIDTKIIAAEMNMALNGRGGGQPVLTQGTVRSSRQAIERYMSEYHPVT